MAKKDIDSLWETLAEAASDARHYISIKDMKRYQEALRVVMEVTEALRLAS